MYTKQIGHEDDNKSDQSNKMHFEDIHICFEAFLVEIIFLFFERVYNILSLSFIFITI